MRVIFDYLSIYSDIIPAILFLFVVSKHGDRALWVLFFLNIYSFSNNAIITTGWVDHFRFNIYILYRLYTVIGYSLIALFFYKSLVSKLIRKIIFVTYFLFVGYAVYDFIRSPLESFDSIPSAIEAILIIIFSIFYLFDQIKNPKVLFIYTLDKFWIVASLLIYYTGTFFLFIYAEAYYGDPTFEENYFLINNLFLLLKNIVFSIGLLAKNNASNNPDGYAAGEQYSDYERILEKRV